MILKYSDLQLRNQGAPGIQRTKKINDSSGGSEQKSNFHGITEFLYKLRKLRC